MRSVVIRLVVLLLILLLVLCAFGAGYLFAPLQPSEPVYYQLAKGTSLSRVAKDLQQHGVVRSAWSLRLLGRYRQLSGQIHTGRYLFSEKATPDQVLERLVRGDVEQVTLTIPEGFTLEQIIARIAEAGFGKAERLRALSSDAEFLRGLGLAVQSLEGYLFPETYRFSPGISEAELLTMMVAQLRAHLTPELLGKAKKLKLDAHQLLTLASIIEKETGAVEEMPLISSVFHNRLRKGIALQTDPTVIYGIKNFDGNLTRKDLQTPTPYNTYVIKGLPPGPIASPGKAALLAAANPAQSHYLYFVSRGDGSHHFSATLKEHNRAVRKYQLKRR